MTLIDSAAPWRTAPEPAHAAEPLGATPFWADLAERTGDALVGEDERVTYDDLAGRVATLARALGRERRLVLLVARNDIDTVVGYLACLAGGHPVLVTEPARAAGLVAAYDPDVVLDGDPAARRLGTRHDLHPDLAVLLSTSGSTGSPKLVRLSRRNVAANAAAIAAALAIRPDDRAVATLPLSYCYGLSVVTSHLAAGASVLLTEASVVADGFPDLLRRHDVTTLPGVPHTFELLERSGFAEWDVPSLRVLTCAGGRLGPDRARRLAALGERRGFGLVLMYGATEATARMAVLPADRVAAHPTLLGDPVPGGSFRLDPLPPTPPTRRARPVDPARVVDRAGTCGAPEAGELVYRGDNVMLGYAEGPADLARGREVHELRTGDLARRTDGGWEIVGRLARFAKVFGLRLDLDRIERVLLDGGVVAAAVDAGDRVVVAVDRSAAPVDEGRVTELLHSAGVPAPAVQVLAVDGLPRSPQGKVDGAALVTAYRDRQRRVDAPSAPGGPASRAGSTRRAGQVGGEGGVREVYEQVVARGRRPVGPADSFVSLGGDSLSYVEVALRLEAVLGDLPPGWHLRSVAELEAGVAPDGRRSPDPDGGPRERALRRKTTRGPRSQPGNARRPDPLRARRVETNVLLRAAAIVMIVGSHANLFMLLGGAHLLVALAGFNLARFQLTDRPRAERVRGMLRAVTYVVVPASLWLTFAAATSWKYDWRNVVLLNGVLGTREWSEAWHYWFIEALVWTVLGVAALLSIRRVDAWERRHPFAFPVVLALAALLTRYDVLRAFGGDYIHRAHVIFWLFALGWAAARATRTRHRLLVSVLAATTIWGFFPGGQPAREATVLVGFLLLVWVPTMRVPAPLARVASVLAAASLYIYLCHWQIYPAYEFELPWLATALSLGAGALFWRVVVRATPPVEAGAGRVARRAQGMLQQRAWLGLRRYESRDEAAVPSAVARLG